MIGQFSVSFDAATSVASWGESSSPGHTLPSKIVAQDRLELREATGQRLRLAPGAEVEFFDSVMGRSFEVYGEVAIIGGTATMSGPGKYRTSCWVCGKIAHLPINLYANALSDTEDEFCLLSGCLSIFEFDENNQPFVICSISAGERALMRFDPSKPMRERYSSSVAAIPSDQLDYIYDKFVDDRYWIPSPIPDPGELPDR